MFALFAVAPATAKKRNKAPATVSPVCVRLDAAAKDKWARFGRVLPIYLGGTIWEAAGKAKTRKVVQRTLKELGVLDFVVGYCNKTRFVLWVPATKGSELKQLFAKLSEAASKAQAKIEFKRSWVFAPQKGRDWLRYRCIDPKVCGLLARLTTAESRCRAAYWLVHNRRPAYKNVKACLALDPDQTLCVITSLVMPNAERCRDHLLKLLPKK